MLPWPGGCDLAGECAATHPVTQARFLFQESPLVATSCPSSPHQPVQSVGALCGTAAQGQGSRVAGAAKGTGIPCARTVVDL